jgi:protein-S-isoprenylcysteine O-methyltransferase Ste14
MEGGFGAAAIIRIIALLTFPISRLICFIILRVKTKNKGFGTRTKKDILLMLARLIFMAGAITVAILSFAIAPQMLWTQIIADPTSTIVMLSIGFAIIVCADILILVSAVKLAKSAKNKEMTLATKGPYRLMRHPMHAAFLVFIIGAFIVRLNWFFDVLMLISWAIGLFELPSEEESLVARYGDSYIQYKKRTGALLPCPVLDCGVSKEKANWIAENRVDTQVSLLPSMTEQDYDVNGNV